MSLKLPFGLRKDDNRYVDAVSVPNGKNCGCICPVCRQGLVAKNQGKQKVAHFAHQSECRGAHETVVHGAAKQIIQELGFVWLPKSRIATKLRFPFIGCAIEENAGNTRADLIVWDPKEHRLAVEIFVTHEIDGTKYAHLRAQEMSCVEYDLSTLSREITYAELKRQFENGEVRAKWIFNRRAEIEKAKRAALEKKVALLERKWLRAKARQFVVVVRKNRAGYTIYHIPGCPQRKRYARGASFANARLDCPECPYCFGIRPTRASPWLVFCAGEAVRELVGLSLSEKHDFLVNSRHENARPCPVTQPEPRDALFGGFGASPVE